jgi:hypothetical protein
MVDSLESANPPGILVTQVYPAGPAAMAGIAAGDIVHSVKGGATRNAYGFSRSKDATPPDSMVILGIQERGREEWIALTVGRSPTQPDGQPLSTPEYGDGKAIARRPGLKLRALGRGEWHQGITWSHGYED